MLRIFVLSEYDQALDCYGKALVSRQMLKDDLGLRRHLIGSDIRVRTSGRISALSRILGERDPSLIDCGP